MVEPTSAKEPIRLTQFSHGAGCGCKIAPAQLEVILRTALPESHFPGLLVGNATRDDAAVFELADGRCVISTTDFFSPIVDDPFDFGRIAATNAVSDVFAMGGSPLLAVAILGWPVDRIPPELAQQVVEGARSICHELGIPLAGGHSIDAPEPFFGLAVTGEVRKEHLKQNSTARAGDLLFLTKPLGVGILSTAQKRGKSRAEHNGIATSIMLQSNRIGALLGRSTGVRALTDVTGFGLAGHLLEMCDGAGLSATLEYARLPLIPEALIYLAEGCYPDGSFRNWKAYGTRVSGAGSMERMLLLSDPQTSGGLLIAVDPASSRSIIDLFEENRLPVSHIGQFVEPAEDRPTLSVS